MERLNLEYLSPASAKRYDFIQIPTLLLDHEAFDHIDYGSKILYGRMLNRASLSVINAKNFTDSNGRLYIIYTVEQVMGDMRCSKPTAVKLLDQLSQIGLVEKRRQGQGKPSLIYVKDFSTVSLQKSKKFTSGSSKNLPSRSKENELLEVQKIDPNQINQNQTNFSNQNYINQSSKTITPVDNFKYGENRNSIDSLNKDVDVQITQGETINSVKTLAALNRTSDNKHNLMTGGEETIVPPAPVSRDDIALTLHNLDAVSLMGSFPKKANRIQEIHNIVDEVLRSNRKEYKISGESIPASLIKQRFLQLNSEHIVYLIESLDKTDSVIKNMKFYLIKSLYNAPLTINNHRNQDGNHFMSSHFGINLHKHNPYWA